MDDARVNMDDDGVQSMLADITMQTDSFIGISMRVLGMEVADIHHRRFCTDHGPGEQAISSPVDG